ncbi:MAG TPA: LysR family transcriptional regulator [Solirubrobacteraceae bacterium]|jgi:DNA-binding transcriptional LysR family regulator|nr:LysR family transcriptional regulator [Solirubrobacteraceae bacterium]
MELRHLRYFVAIAEERGFTRAAERLWVAQPGLSTQIRRLEAELGVQLFDRHARGVDLTQAGEVFLERARAVLGAAEIATATGRDLKAGVLGHLRLGVATGAHWRGTSGVLERFGRERAGVELTVLEGYGGTLWRDLRDGRLDALLAPSIFGSADLRRLDLDQEPWVVLMARSHRLAGVGPLAACELNGEQIAVTAHRDGAGYDRAVADLLSELGVAAAMVTGAPGPALHTALAQGLTVALATAPETLHPDVLARTLDPRRALTFGLYWRDQTPSPVLAEFIRVTATCLERGPSSARALSAVA